MRQRKSISFGTLLKKEVKIKLTKGEDYDFVGMEEIEPGRRFVS